MRDYQVVWRGLFGDNTGYSQVSRHSVLALDKLGLNVRLEVFQNGAAPAQLPVAEQEALARLISQPALSPALQVIHLQPNVYEMYPQDRSNFTKRLGFTVWETDTLPAEWVGPCNTMDGLIVPSELNKRVFAKSGVTVPIYVARHGIDPTKFYPEGEPLDWFDPRPGCVFLSVCSWQHRKGIDVLLEAYLREFTAKDDVALVVKVSGVRNTDDLTAMVQQYKTSLGLKHETAPLYLASDDLPTAELHALYRTAHCFVLPSRGEGVGLPYLEAMASGLPCIAPVWGGQTDFITKQNGFFLEGELGHINEQAAAFPWFRAHMRWFQPDRVTLSKLLRYVAQNPQERARKGKRAAETVHPAWTWDATVQDLVTIFDEVMGGGTT